MHSSVNFGRQHLFLNQRNTSGTSSVRSHLIASQSNLLQQQPSKVKSSQLLMQLPWSFHHRAGATAAQQGSSVSPPQVPVHLI
jgi:hypothetical protein